jgi:hypothetical protein
MSIKSDLMKEIDAKVARRKELAKKLSREKTVANWVSEFFSEYDNTRKLDQGNGYEYFTSLALSRLAIQLRNLDRKCTVDFRQDENGGDPVVDIHWSPKFVQANNCEDTISLDAATASFQSAMEDI